MQPGQLFVGDVVQIAPEHGLMWGGCFVFVEEPKSWGCQGFIATPKAQEQPPARIYVRLRWEHMELIGRAVFVPSDLGGADTETE